MSSDQVGEGEASDSVHFASSLLQRIQSTPYQAIGSHTFSHYYCREQGQTKNEFDSDLQVAIKAAEKHGIKIVLHYKRLSDQYGMLSLNMEELSSWAVTCTDKSQTGCKGEINGWGKKQPMLRRFMPI